MNSSRLFGKHAARAAGRSFAAIALLFLIAGLLVGFGLDRFVEQTATSFPTPYQAVLLSNGAVYYGKLQGYGTTRPVLTEVYYIVTETNPETKQPSNVLVKRGKELHEPDRMYLNPNSIVFVEPVGVNSKVAQLIAANR
jgi:hypothetical protein